MQCSTKPVAQQPHQQQQICGMDLLAGYGSGSESDGDDLPARHVALNPSQGAMHAAPGTTTAAANRAGGLLSSLPRPKDAAPGADAVSNGPTGLPAGFFDSSKQPAAAAAGDPPAALPAGFFDSAPASAAQPSPANGTAGDDQQLFGKLPEASKRKVLLRPQIDLKLLAQQSDSDDDEPVAKKVKKAAGPAAGKPSILSFLPAPKNTAGNKRMELGGGGSNGSGAGAAAGGSSGFAEAAQLRKEQQEQERAAQAAAAAVGPQAPVSNEMYRMRPAVAAAAASSGDAYGYAQQQQQYYAQHYDQQQYYEQQHAYAAGAYAAHQQQPRQPRQQHQQLAPEEAFLQEALQAEASKAARRAAGAGSSQLVMPNIQFKEVKADEVKYVDPGEREAAQGMRSALGTEYAQQLRAQAAPHMGSKLARSKHQIGTLFANAKLRELEVMENRASGMKSKAETAGKYGW